MNLVETIKKVLPDNLLILLKKIHKRTFWKKYKELTPKEVFTKIYSEHVWGNNTSNPNSYFSGGGSHDVALTGPYIEAVKKFILGLTNKPDVMDLGCGDFNIGSKIRGVCNNYIACDIVDSLIEQNRVAFKDLHVDFRVFDLTEEKCESVDIVFLRQVLQHLSNDDIQKGLKNIVPYCKYLVLTEHLPIGSNFKRNIDKPTGPDVRADLKSGIDITSLPFKYTLKGECICEVPDAFGIIKTIVYKCN